MLRTLVILIALALVFVLVKRLLGAPKGRAPIKRWGGGHQKMVRCEVCGLHVPEDEALSVEGRHYCSEEHRRLGTG